MWWDLIFFLFFIHGVSLHTIDRRQTFDSFTEIVRQKTRGNQINQCPCVLHPQSNQCITYDSRYLAVSIEEAMLSFLDLSNDRYPPFIVNSRTFKCESTECQQCFSILFHKLVQVGFIDSNYRTSIAVLDKANLQPSLCPRYSFTRPPRSTTPPSSVPVYVSSMVSAGEAFHAARSRSVPGFSRRPNAMRRRVVQRNRQPSQQRSQLQNSIGNSNQNKQPSQFPRPQQNLFPGRSQGNQVVPSNGQNLQNSFLTGETLRNTLPLIKNGITQFTQGGQNWGGNSNGGFNGGFNGGTNVGPNGGPNGGSIGGNGGLNGGWGAPSVAAPFAAPTFSGGNFGGGFGGAGGGLNYNRFGGFGGFGRHKRAEKEVIGRRYTLGCINKGDSDDDHISLCGTCWTWRQLPEGYFPRIINELSCRDGDYCLSGWGECSQQYRNVDVLRREDDKWVPTVITTATCCDCKVRAGTEIHSLVIGQKK